MPQAEQNDPARTGGKRLRAVVFKAVKWGLFLAVLAFVVRAFVRRLGEVSWGEIDFHLPLAALGVLAVLLAKALAFLLYGTLLGRFWPHPGWRAMISSVWMAQVAKYVPGKVGSVVGMVVLLRRHHVPARVAVSTVVVVDGLSVILGMMVAVPLTLWEPVRARLPLAWLWCLLGLLGGAACLHPRIFGAAGNRLLKALGYPGFTSLPRVRDYLLPIAVMLVQFAVLGLGYWLIARSLHPVPAGLLPLFVSATVLAAIGGFLAFFAPAGLGVQEWVLMVVLGPALAGGLPALLAVVMRLVQTLTEVALAAVGVVLRRTSAAPPAPAAPPPAAPARRADGRPARIGVLFDITHPAQVHFFKNAVRRLRAEGDRVVVTARDKDVTLDLLGELGIAHVCISRMGGSLAGKARELLRRDAALLRIARRVRPDVMVGKTGISLAPVGALLGIPRVVFEDTEHARLERALSLPFATCICTGAGYMADHGRRQVRFRGLPVLAYLAPEYFHPDPECLRRAGIDPDRPYIVLRRVSWKAVHDRGITGPGEADLLAAVRRLQPFGRVLISSEGPLPESLRPLASPAPLSRMHDLLARARLYIGESGTMAAEAGALGTPSVYCNPLPLGFLVHMERRYGLVRNTRCLAEALPAAESLLSQTGTHRLWQRRRQRLLEESVDVTAFMCRLIRRIARGAPTFGGGASA